MEEAARAAAAAASGLPVDDERLPAGAIFNAVVGPVESVIIGDDEEDAPDGFDDDEKNQVESVDPVLEAINSAVSAAIEESDAVKTSSKKKTPDDFDDLVTKSTQDAAEEINPDAADSPSDDDRRK
jgi:hypothetical protein